MDPLALRIVVVGIVLLTLGLGADVALELTGHAASAAMSLAVKVATLGLTIVSMVLAGQAGSGMSPPKTLAALLMGRPGPPGPIPMKDFDPPKKS